ncbi:FAD-dependent oxidoreductase [Hydrogenophaga sp. BPS33]|uniref:FAD-dependent oxidoreductase n=1 Tax=Hydrogenophaga sp. BPS33 TaxID=2651974 RepID=UPI00131FBA63|nr:FAD-dependent oxidoreductase [Hydrogenophaga sp. BPS33]QHE84297.1 FAD-dependent oxidoreductase [Hydrogenophaga sp. BPS33]
MDEWDVIVVGSGVAGLSAACVAAAEGASVLVLEQAEQVGGTTAISGGMVWMPANFHMQKTGVQDTICAARTYLSHAVPGTDRDRLEAFLSHCNEALRYMEKHTQLRMRPVAVYPDYYPDLPGATTGGRVLEPEPYDATALGAHFKSLRAPLPEFMLFGGMMVSRQDIPHLRRASTSMTSAVHVAKLLLRYGRQRLAWPRGTTLYLGNALAARLYESAMRLGVTIRTGTAALQLDLSEGRVRGVCVAGRADTVERLGALRGVVLASGGLSHAGELRARSVPSNAGTFSAGAAPGRAPRGAKLALEAGATLSRGLDQGAFWVPVSRFVRADGTVGLFPHTVTDRGKPGLIAVNSAGARFTNESRSYHEFVKSQLRQDGRAIPAWLVCDSRFLWKYGLGCVKPFTVSLHSQLASGYLKRSRTMEGLAQAIGVPPPALAHTVAQYNSGAREGLDPAFGRGGDAYQRHMGDGDHKPNPCVAPILRAPFYAVAVWPADLGMATGIRTDQRGRVLTADGAAIDGLYACGNDMASVMEGAYPAPGITLGPAITFAYLAGRHVAQRPPWTSTHPASAAPA